MTCRSKNIRVGDRFKITYTVGDITSGDTFRVTGAIHTRRLHSLEQAFYADIVHERTNHPYSDIHICARFVRIDTNDPVV